MSVKHERGRFGEDYTADFLVNNGYEIVVRNFRKRGGELDIVALKDSELAVVEVKTRKFGSLTEGIDAITYQKKKNIIQTTAKFLNESEIEFSEMRFDVAEIVVTTEENPQVIEFNYYENAFTADGFETITAWL